MIKIFYALYNNPLMQIEISFVMLAKIGVKSLCDRQETCTVCVINRMGT